MSIVRIMKPRAVSPLGLRAYVTTLIAITHALEVGRFC
jgi:hypothetical protein